MSEVTFSELPPKRGRARISHAIVAAQLRHRSGEWGLVDRRPTAGLAASGAYNIRNGVVKYYEPKGSFEAVSRAVPVVSAVDGTEHIEHQVWARYVGEAQ